MKLEGRLAVITGGSGTIGGAIAHFFVREGAQVLLAGRNQAALAAIAAQSPRREAVSLRRVDVGEANEMKEFFDQVADTWGRLDILVTAAGVYGEINPLEAADPIAWQEAFKINVFGTMHAVCFALPLLKKSHEARVITFAGGGEGPLARFSSYASSKGAILRFAETAAAELWPLGITVNAISPGLVNSGFVSDLIAAGPERSGRQKYEEARQQLAGIGGAVSPERAAALAVFLASSEAGALTGKNISAVWDKWEDIPRHLPEIMNSDIYTSRRIKPKDRGYAW